MALLHSLSVPDEERPRRAFVLHGILGNLGNWRGFARRLARDLPDTTFHLVDLRNHGDSPRLPGPHTLAAAADDLEELAGRIGAPDVVIGHSYGGKVTLEYASRRPVGLQQAWVLDATPHALPDPGDDNEVRKVMAALRSVPLPLAKRADVVPLLAERGLPRSIGTWMTTNLRPDGDGYVWTFDLDAAEAMLADYFRQDLWSPLETTDPDAPRVHLVRASRSDRWTPDVRARLDAIPADAAGTAHVLSGGHWIHVDAPDALRALFSDHWPS